MLGEKSATLEKNRIEKLSYNLSKINGVELTSYLIMLVADFTLETS